MTFYCDASVILRCLLREPDRLVDLKPSSSIVASELIRVECYRVLDRMRLTGDLDDEDRGAHHGALSEWFTQMKLIELSQAVLRRASEPFPTAIGTLDAIHLASALLWREENPGDVLMATHDRKLGTAARAYGIKVIGV